MDGDGGNDVGADGRRQATFGNIDDAMARLQGAFDRLRDEVEASARDEWVRAKPELRQRIVDLQRLVDDLARRAKTALDDLGAKLGDRDRPPGA